MTPRPRRSPLEFDLADQDRLNAELRRVAAQGWADQGRVLATFRPWPHPLAWPGVVLPPLALGLTAFWATTREEVLLRLGLTAVAVVMCVVNFLVPGTIDTHRVCEHGLRVGFRRRTRYVVPWDTVDPGRVTVVRRPNFLPRYRGLPPVASPHHRTGYFTPHAVLLNGFDSATRGWLPVPGWLGTTEQIHPRRRERRTPFVWWTLGVRNPRPFLEAVEAAMVADGYAAHGLADRALAQGLTARYRVRAPRDPFPARELTDPVVGVDGPLLNPDLIG